MDIHSDRHLFNQSSLIIVIGRKKFSRSEMPDQGSGEQANGKPM